MSEQFSELTNLLEVAQFWLRTKAANRSFTEFVDIENGADAHAGHLLDGMAAPDDATDELLDHVISSSDNQVWEEEAQPEPALAPPAAAAAGFAAAAAASSWVVEDEPVQVSESVFDPDTTHDDTPSWIVDEPEAEPESTWGEEAPAEQSSWVIEDTLVPESNESDDDDPSWLEKESSSSTWDEPEEVTVVGGQPEPEPEPEPAVEPEPEPELPVQFEDDHPDEASTDDPSSQVIFAEKSDDDLLSIDVDEEEEELELDMVTVDGDEDVNALLGLSDDEEEITINDDEAAEEDFEDPESDEVVLSNPRPTPPRVAPTPQVSAGLYGNPTVPTIREGNQPKPRAAAIQINAQGGGGKMLALEEDDEPIEIGAPEDYGEEPIDDEFSGDGFTLSLQEYEYEEEYDEEPELEDDEVIVAAPVPQAPIGPSVGELQDMLKRAREAAELGNMEEGTNLYTDVIDLDPDNGPAYVGRGRLYLDLGDYTRAMSDFMIAEEIEPDSPEPQVATGNLYFARKDYRRAIEYFDAALSLAPEHAMAHCRRGISYYYRKSYQAALQDLQKSQRLDPDIPNIGTYISMAKKKTR